MHGTGTKHIVRHRQKSVVQWSDIYPSKPVYLFVKNSNKHANKQRKSLLTILISEKRIVLINSIVSCEARPEFITFAANSHNCILWISLITSALLFTRQIERKGKLKW